MQETKLYCKNCNRYLGLALGNAKVSELICAKCKHRNSFDIRTPKKEKTNEIN